MILYDVTGHGLLSNEAKQLEAEQLEQWNELAEELLDITDSSWTGDDAEIATRAVALQVNHLVAMDPEASALQSWRRGERIKQYRPGLVTVNRIAASLISGLRNAKPRWMILRGVR